MATTEKISDETKKGIVGKKIVEVGDNWIRLDNGLRIYLGDKEVSDLNYLYED